MMDCGEIRRRLPELLSGELDAGKRRECETHLGGCPACAREFAAQRETDELLRAAVARHTVDASAVQARVWAQIRAAGRERTAAPRGKTASLPGSGWRGFFAAWRWPAPLTTAVAALVLFVAGIYPVIAWRQRSAAGAVQAMVRDHREDVIERVKKTGWMREEDVIRRFAGERFADPALPAELAADGYRLTRVRLSRLQGEDYAHFVYAVDGREVVSFFVRRRGLEDRLGLARPVDPAPGDGELRATDFQSSRLRIIVVGGLPPAELQALARAAAARLRV